MAASLLTAETSYSQYSLCARYHHATTPVGGLGGDGAHAELRTHKTPHRTLNSLKLRRISPDDGASVLALPSACSIWQAKVSLPGGCAIGTRQLIDTDGFPGSGAEVNLRQAMS